MTGTIDFTNCKKILGRVYNGANGKKIAVEYNGREYMLKFPPSGAMKPTELSYTNSCISEHIASSIFNMLGIKAQETILGTYEVSGKTKVVCACLEILIGIMEIGGFYIIMIPRRLVWLRFMIVEAVCYHRQTIELWSKRLSMKM